MLSPMRRTVLPLVLLLAACAAGAAQFRAEDFGLPWSSADGSAGLWRAVVHAGWTHDEAVLWLRNLVRKITGKAEDDDTDHCVRGASPFSAPLPSP
jgi:hypothetical protein